MIKIHNDGKKKSESWEARLELDSIQTRPDEVGIPPAGFLSMNAIGYGPSEEEAMQDLQRLLRHLGDMLLHRMDWNTREYVTWDGKPSKRHG